MRNDTILFNRTDQAEPIEYARRDGGNAMSAGGHLIRRLAKQVLHTIAPDPQTLVLLRSGAKGTLDSGSGLRAAWTGWTAPLIGKWTAAEGAGVEQPTAYPRIDLAGADPIAEITSAAGFATLDRFFAEINQAERALVSAKTQAVLYALVRNLRPEHVIEIGTYRASTSKAMVRAMHANARGFMHTVDPANSGPILRLIRRWPVALRERVCYYPMSSMDFFNLAVFQELTSDLIFVDGNHDYEYALFDIQSAARLIRPGGFIAIDNINQAGPFFAAFDFMRDHPAWHECGHSLKVDAIGKGFDHGRSTIRGTDLCVIRSPRNHIVGQRLETAGPQRISQTTIGGIELAIARPATGTLHAQYVVRVREPVMSEVATQTSRTELRDAVGPTRVALPWDFAPDEVPLERTIELWLAWTGDAELELAEPPALF